MGSKIKIEIIKAKHHTCFLIVWMELPDWNFWEEFERYLKFQDLYTIVEGSFKDLWSFFVAENEL